MSLDQRLATVKRINTNLHRVFSYSDIVSSIEIQLEPGTPVTSGEPLPSPLDEIIRSAIVFLHSVLEDSIREIARTEYKNFPKEKLNDIPLLSTSYGYHPKKFFLGELYDFKDKTVDYIFQVSISNYLDQQSFNKIEDIISILTAIGYDYKEYEETFSHLQELIDRRHQIVHKADLLSEHNTTETKDVILDDYLIWTDAVDTFIRTIIKDFTGIDPDNIQQAD